MKDRKEYYSKYWSNHKEERSFNVAKTRMRKRNLPFELSITEYKNLKHEACSYCGCTYALGSVDRIDSSMGYTKDNVQPICFRCNRTKSSQSHYDFIKYIEKIYKYINKGKIDENK